MSPRVEWNLRLIAGSYTPVTLTVLHDSSGLFILTGVWIIAAIGFVFKIFFTGRFEYLSLIMYLGMGWFIVFYSKTVLEVFSSTAIFHLVFGGLFYTGVSTRSRKKQASQDKG